MASARIFELLQLSRLCLLQFPCFPCTRPLKYRCSGLHVYALLPGHAASTGPAFAGGVGPSAALHRRLLSQWQAHLLLADAEWGLLPTVTRLFFGAPRPNLRFVRISPNRAGAADYQHPAANASAMAANFAAGVRSDHQLRPLPPPELWLAELGEVSRDIRAIRARGGRVMFFCSPTSGAHLAADQQGYPRADYWDRFVREIAEPNGAHAIYGLDVPAIAALNLPDGSHLDMRDRAAFTAAVAQLLTDANAR